MTIAITKGSTADIAKALFKAANKLPDSLPDSVINKATLADMLLARAGSQMTMAPVMIETLGAKIQSTLASNPKLGAKLEKDSEMAQSEITNNANIRKSLEKHFMEYASSRSAETQRLVKDMLDGKLSPDALLTKLKDLDKKSDDLTKKITAYMKTSSDLEEKLKTKLEEILRQIPGGVKELQALLHPEKPQL